MKFMRNNTIPLLISLMIMILEIAISFNATFLPDVKAEYGVSEQLVQLSVGLGVFALGAAGLVYGGLSQSFGRKRLIVTGVCLFAFGTLVSGMAVQIGMLFAGRLIQGAGAGVGWIVGNACLKDVYYGIQYTKVMNIVHTVAGIVPAVAPVVGVYLAAKIGWRGCMLGLFALSIVVILTIQVFLRETHTHPKKVGFGATLAVYGQLFGRRDFLRFYMVKVMSVLLLFCETSNVPLVYMDHLHVLSSDYGYYVAVAFAAYALGSYLSSYLCSYWTASQLVVAGLSLVIISNAAIALWGTFSELSAWDIQAVKSLTFLGWGFIFGNATANIVSAAPSSPGAATAVMIASEMMASAVGIYLLSFFYNGTIMPLTMFMILISGATMAGFIAVSCLGKAPAHREEFEVA